MIVFIKSIVVSVLVAATFYVTSAFIGVSESTTEDTVKVETTSTSHKTVNINGVDIFYREAGDTSKPTILLLHGYPTSSHMFRNLITDLSVRYHVLAPDYPGFGRSGQPAIKDFDYTFDNMAILI